MAVQRSRTSLGPGQAGRRPRRRRESAGVRPAAGGGPGGPRQHAADRGQAPRRVGGGADRADSIQHSWDDHLARARERIDARKAQHAADRVESDAEDAESYAAYSIDLAYSAIEEAEYAVLARADADEAAPAVAT